MTIIHVMTRLKTLKNGAEVWQCSTCRRKDMITRSGKRYTITPGVRAPHGLLDRIFQHSTREEASDVRPAGRQEIQRRAAESLPGEKPPVLCDTGGTMPVCAICHRKLNDPESIRLGIGPECRKGHAFGRRLARSRDWYAGKVVEIDGWKFDPNNPLDADWMTTFGRLLPRATVERLKGVEA